MKFRIPFRFWGPDDAGESRIREGLSDAGLDLIPVEGSEGAVYGIICFSVMDQGLVRLIQSLRNRSFPRILALAVSKDVLQNGDVWRLLEAGAADSMEWSGDASSSQILARVERCHLVERAWAEALTNAPIAGVSAAWRELVRRVVEAGRFSSAPILLTGESGTGKERLARLVHTLNASQRRGTRASRDGHRRLHDDCPGTLRQ